MRIPLLWLFCVPLVLLEVSCQKQPQASSAPPLDSSTVARVDSTEISAEIFKRELLRRFPALLEEPLTGTQKRSVLESLIRNETLYAKAKRVGFDRAPDVQASIKALVVARFKEKQFTPPEGGVTSREIESYYLSHSERFKKPGAARGAVILVSCPASATAEKRAEARTRAEGIGSEAKKAADAITFGQLAARYDEDQVTRYRGGDTGWLSSGARSFPPDVVKALMAMQTPNEFAPLVETPHGFWIIKLLERREPAKQALVEVRELISHELSRQKAELAERDFYTRMAQGVNVQVNQTLVDSIELPSEPLSPPSVPGPRTAQLQSQNRL